MTAVIPGPNRAVLITGASSGFGLAALLAAAKRGFTTIGLVPDRPGAVELATAASSAGVVTTSIVADLSDPEQRGSVVEEIGRPLYGLVNNAGYMNAGRVRDVEIARARRQLETMVLAPMDLARQALPQMVARGEGRIVNVTSSAVHASTPMTGWYQAAKAALRELNDSLRLELAGSGVHVIDVEPGGYQTGIWPRATGELQHQKAKQGTDSKPYTRILHNLGRFYGLMGDPAEVGAAIVDLLVESRPPAHVRLGPGARSLRVLSEILPERVWDTAVTKFGRPT